MNRIRTLLLATLCAAAGCEPETGGPLDNEPQEVARITVAPEAVTLARGASTSLTANLEDAEGNPIHDRPVDWLTYDASVATVSNGVVTGVAAGTATITATADGKRGSARVTVTAPASGLAITSLSPNPFVEGQPALINGSGFGFVPSNLRVTIDGTNATITATNSTSIQVVVPQTGCKPARNVDVQVRLLASYSNVVKHPLRPANSLGLSVGQQALARDPASFCLQFAASSAAEVYLIGVQSTSDEVAHVTPVTLAAASATAGGAGGAIAELVPAERHGGPGAFPADERVPSEWLRERAAETRVRNLDRKFLRDIILKRPQPELTSAAVPTIPSSPRIGDVLTIRVPAFDDQCNRFATTTAVVRAITPRAIWLDDPNNPAGGFGPADIQSFASLYENYVYDTNIDLFGPVTDMDRNGRIAIVITKEVNRLAAQFDSLFALGGMVKPVNWFPSTTCPASNESEIIYLQAPDPTGRYGPATGSAAETMPAMRILLAHEFVHLIQFSHQVPGNPTGAVVQPNWLNEALATMAEEAVGHRLGGRTSGRNYGVDVAYNRGSPGEPTWYRAISWMGYYFGYATQSTRAAGAPEQCSWIGLSSEGNDGPCASNDLVTYGVAWSFVRWLSDQFGPAIPGGEKALQHTLVNSRYKGFAAISNAVGVPIDALLAQWAAALYLDDRTPTVAPGNSFTSWNLHDIESGRNPTARLVPRERGFTSFSDVVHVRAASTAYFRVSGAGRPATAIVAHGSNGTLPAHMRLWVVRVQ